MKTSSFGVEAERATIPQVSTHRVRAARALAFVGIGSLALSLGITPALADASPSIDSIQVSGTILVLPEEPGGADSDGASNESGTWLATDEGPVIPIDERTLGVLAADQLVSGATLEGTVELPRPAADAVNQAAEAAAANGEDEPDKAEILQTASDALAETEQALPVTDAEVALPAEAAETTGVPHQADIVMFKQSGQTVPSDSEIDALITRVSDFWVAQSNGRFGGIASASIKRLAISSADVCSSRVAWEKAAGAYGRTQSSYATAGSTRHLIALVIDSGCGAGMGTVGSKLNGGIVWANLDDYTASRGAVVGAQTLAHEFGHNFGLGHANARLCSGSTPDSKTVSGTAASPCADSEYGDLWSVMGVGIRGYTSRPAALAINQRDFLDATGGDMLQTVTPAGGASQTFVLNALTAGSGLRGIRVEPELGEPFYVEYRNGSGQDSGMPQASGTSVVIPRNGQKLRVTPGVRVIKSLDRVTGRGSTVLSRNSSGYFYQAMTAGRTVIPFGQSAKVSVLSTGSASAKVRIDFADPFLALGTPAITGQARTGITLSARADGWTPKPEAVTYQWLRGGTEIAGATSSKYLVAAADLGSTISVRVTGDRAGQSKSATSKTTATVRRSMRTVKPTIAGVSKVGRLLAVHRGSWAPSGVSFSYRWLRNGQPIGGATSSKYRLKSQDRGKRISVRVTGHKSGYYTTARVAASVRIR